MNISKRRWNVFLITLIVFQFALIFFNNFKLYTTPFDKEKMYEKYYKSQWVIPQSINGISDGDLYQVAGYELVTTGTHYKINPEVPPLGKLLFGYAILTFGNAYIASYILLFLISFAFFVLTRFYIKTFTFRLIATALLIIDPLFASFGSETLLDPAMLLALILHAIFLFKTLECNANKQFVYSSFAGLAFGSFMAVKIGVLGFIPLVIHIILLLKNRKILLLAPFLLASLFIYLLSYYTYFLQGNSLLQLLKDHKWMVSFYLASKVVPVYGAVFVSLFTGYIRGWDADSTWVRVREWSLMWPIFSISLLLNISKYKKKVIKSDYALFIVLLIVCLLLMYSIIPFFARYLLLVIPFLIILFVQRLETFQKKT